MRINSVVLTNFILLSGPSAVIFACLLPLWLILFCRWPLIGYWLCVIISQPTFGLLEALLLFSLLLLSSEIIAVVPIYSLISELTNISMDWLIN